MKRCRFRFFRILLSGLLLLSIPIFTGCEGFRCASGIVVDAQSLEPLDSVLCSESTSADTVFTDQEGRYDICGIFSGCVPDCPDILVRYSREGYVTAEYVNPEQDTILLERE